MVPILEPSIDEQARLEAWRESGLLDTTPDLSFDRLAHLACRILKAPIALVSLFKGDKQFFKSYIGLPEHLHSLREIPLSDSICQHLIASVAPLAIADIRKHPEFCDKRAAASLGVVAYLGIPLVTPLREVVGSFCVIDTVSREWTEEEIQILDDLAASVMTEIRLRQETHQVIRAKQELLLLSTIVESSEDAIISINLDGATTSWNQGAEKIFGSSTDDAIGKHFGTLLRPDCAALAAELLEQVKNGTPVDPLEIFALRKDGGEVTLLLSVSPVKNQAGSVAGASIIAHDVTALKQAERERIARATAEAERAESEAARELVTNILESVSDAFVALDNNWRYVYVNKKAAEIFNRHDLVGKHIWTEFPEAIDQPFYKAYQQAVREQTPLEIEEYYEPYGRWFENRIYPSKDGLSIFFQDVTERKLAREKIRETEERYRHIVDTANEGIWTIDAGQRTTYVNQRMADMLGYRAEEILGRDFRDFVEPESWEDTKRNVDQRRAGVAEQYDFRLCRKDGSDLWVLVSSSPIKDRNGNYMGSLAMVSDITQRKLAEVKLRESGEQLRALTARLESVRENERTHIAREIHDVLGQYLTSFKIDLSWLSRRLSQLDNKSLHSLLSGRVKGMVDLVDETIVTIQNISSELRPGVLDSLGLGAAIEWQANEFQKRTEILCRCQLPDDAIDLTPDRSTALFRIFQEILTNVARHSGATEVEVILSCDSEGVLLTVRDNGRGVTESELTDFGSLGLLGMRERAALLGGEVSISGKPGEGTEVVARIPFKPVTTARSAGQI
jgi:PAS domain S-box-containing protein